MSFLGRCLAFLVLIKSLASAMTIGFYAMVPIVRDKPYTAERHWRFTSGLAAGTQTVDDFRTIMVRDTAGRLREESLPTPPDARGSFRIAGVRILDPVTMQQIDLDPAAKTYRRSPIPPEVTSSAQAHRGAILDCAKLAARQKDVGMGDQAERYESLGDDKMFGIAVRGCRITRIRPAPEQWMVSEIWSSPELQIDLREQTRYGNGREDLNEVTSLTLAEPDPALFRVPADFMDPRQRPGAPMQTPIWTWSTSTAPSPGMTDLPPSPPEEAAHWSRSPGFWASASACPSAQNAQRRLTCRTCSTSANRSGPLPIQTSTSTTSSPSPPRSRSTSPSIGTEHHSIPTPC